MPTLLVTSRQLNLWRYCSAPWTWAAICALVRLAMLAVLPFNSGLFLDRETRPAAARIMVTGFFSAAAFLERRTAFHPLTVDEHCYDEMGQNIAGGRGFVLDSQFIITTPGQPAMYAGCGYPLFIAAIYLLAGSGNELPVFLVQIALQSAAVWLVVLTSARIAGRLAGALAGAFFTFHPVLIWLSVALMSEAILIPGVAFLGWMFTRRDVLRSRNGRWGWRPAVSGLVLAILCLTRSTCAGFVLIATAQLLYEARHEQPKLRVLAPAAAMLLVFALACAPWTARNYMHWGRFIPFSTKSGVNAWFFNHPGQKVEFGPGAVDGVQPIDIFDPRIQSLPDEAARDARLAEMFWDFVRHNPAKFAGLCWMRFWMAVLPVRVTSTTLTAALSAWYAKGMVLALLGALVAVWPFKRWRSRRLALRVWPLVLLVFYWQAIQTLAGPGLRYRLPVEPVWSVLVGILAAILIALFIRRPNPSRLTHRWTCG